MSYELIKREPILEFLSQNTSGNDWLLNQYNADWIYCLVASQPTVDAVPVVRCKDCKHRGDHEVCPLHDIRLYFDGDGHMDEVEDDKTEDEFFCSYGERKEDDGND